MNMIKRFTCALALVPCMVMATSEEQLHAEYYSTMLNLTASHGFTVDDEVRAMATCGNEPSCTFEKMSVPGYGCLLNNLATVIDFAGEYDAATWPTETQSTATASFDITTELPFPAGDIDPDDYIGNYQIAVNYYYNSTSETNELNAEIIAKPVNADYSFMWFMVNFAFNGGLLGRQFPNCSKM